MGNDNAHHFRPRQVRRHPLGQGLPHGMAHVFAVELGDLLGLQRHAAQSRHGGDKVRHAELAGGVAHVVARLGRGAGNGATGAQEDDLFSFVLHFDEVWIKIQILDTTSALEWARPS